MESCFPVVRFGWRNLTLLLGSLMVMTMASWIALPLAGPVPITLQVFAVVLGALSLGRQRAVAVQAAYISLLVCGAPVSAFKCGPVALFGPTGGYLLAFLPATWVIATISERVPGVFGRSLAAALGIGIIYAMGFSVLMVYLHSAGAALAAGVRPFVGVDTLKAAVAVAATGSTRRWLLDYLAGGA